MAIAPPRAKNQKRKPVHPVKINSHPQEMDKLEEQGIIKSRPVIKTS